MRACRSAKRDSAWLLMAAIAIAGCHTPTPRERALTMIARGQVREGVVELEKIKDQNPNDVRAWIDLGHGYELLHRYDDALLCYDHAAEIAPKDPRGPREGGLRAAAWGEKEIAIPRLREAIARGDEDPSTFHALGLVLLASGDREGARKAYEAGLATPRGKDDATCVLGLATLAVVEKDGAGALRWYDELAHRRPKHAGAQLGRAWALGTLGRFDEAENALKLASSLGAKDEDVARLRVWLEERRAKK
ncbi:MAG: tetratricopeptide repeat protein [Polyangiales bacterium]